MALIELSLDPPAAPGAAAPPPASYYRRTGLLLSVLLLLTLGGTAPVRSALWQRVGGVPLPAAGDFQLIGGTLFTVDLDAEPRVLTAWQTDPVRPLWTYPSPSVEDPFYVSAATAGFVVVRSGRTSTVLDAHTGARKWTPPVTVQPVNDSVAFLEEEIFEPGTEYDAESGDPGQLYGTTSSVLHTQPALRTELHGVDLDSGARRWSLSFPGTVFTTLTDAPGRLAVVLSADRLTVLDPVTGAVLRQRAVPRIDGSPAQEGEVIGDTVLVHYGTFGTGGLVAAYALDTLDELWRQNQPDPAGNSATCPGLICVRSSDELTVLNPRTGEWRWRISDTDVLGFGPDSVLAVQGLTSPLRTADAATGRPRIDLGWWRFYFPLPGGRAYVLSRLDDDRTTVFGLLEAGATAVQPLGRIPDTTVQCQAVPGLVACRVADGIEVWAYPG